jgi:ADP-ribosyl-[dinitrogen reductase] hydrolase
MMFEIGVGDAYGACYECCDRKFVEVNNELRDMTYTNHPRKLRRRPDSFQPSLVPSGAYTDDTQMALAIAEAMLDDTEPWTVESLADRFVEVFRRDERRGYTVYFLNVLMNSRNGTELLSKIDGRSTKSGGAMRAGPIGLYPNIREVVAKAKRQAMVTHNSWLGTNSAVGAALMTHYFYYDLGPKAELVDWLRDTYFGDALHADEPFEVDGQIVECWQPGRKVRVHAWDVLEAAIYAIESSDSLKEILWQCVDYTGDVDTVAAIAMGPASLSREIDQDLPADLLDNFESRRYGRDYLKLLDTRLFEKFPRKDDDEPEALQREAEVRGGAAEVAGEVRGEQVYVEDVPDPFLDLDGEPVEPELLDLSEEPLSDQV